jgi:hypothetical protein
VAIAGGPFAFMLFGLLLSLVAGFLSWIVVEGPALRLAARCTSRAR